MTMSATTRPPFQRFLRSMALILPVAYYIHEKCYMIHTITDDTGTSMEPALRKGDTVLVRKADFLPHYPHRTPLDVRHLEEGVLRQ